MSSKELQLALKIKADLQSAIRDVDRFEKELLGAGKAANVADKSSRSAAAGIDALGRSIITNTAITGRYTNELEKIGGGLKSVAASVKALTLTFAAGFGFAEILRSADAWTAYQNRLRLVSGSQSELASASQNVYEIARNTSQQLDGTAAIYQRFAQNADRLNISLTESAELTGTVSKAIAISGGSAASGEAALVQFGQALASGVLRGEEFNSVMEQAPGLALALANGLDVDIGKLREMANEGELTADVLVDALARAKDGVDEQFETRIRTISQAATEFDTAFTRLVGTFSTGEGAGEGLANLIGELADLLDVMADNADILGAALDVALVLTAGKALTALTNLTTEGIKNVAMQKAATTAAAQKALAIEATAAASKTAALAELENTTAALRAAEAEVAITSAEARRTAGLAASSTLLSGKAGLESAAATAAKVHSVAEARLAAAQEARAAASVVAMTATTNLTKATVASTSAVTAAAAASSLLTRAIVTATAVGGRLLSFLGGPLGLVITLGLAATAFLDFGGEAEVGMNIAANATEKASVRVRNATREMIKSLQFGDVNTASFDQISQGIETLELKLKAAVKERDRLQTLEDQDIVFGVTGNIEEAQEKVRSLEAAIRKLQQQQAGERFDGVRAGDKYLENLDRQKDRIKNITELEKAQTFLRKQGIDQSSEMGQKILTEAAANDELIKTKREEQAAERQLQSARNEAQRDMESRLRDQQRFVEQLERQVAVQNLTEQELREYTLAEQGLTGAMLARAKAANQALLVQERMNQALQDANTLEDIQIQLLRSSGKTVEARALELEQQFGELLKRLKSRGDQEAIDGAALVDRLIDVELARTRLDEVQAEIDKAFSQQNLSEQSIQTELDAGLIDELEARDRLLRIHHDTADVLETQRPLLEELAQQPGAVGEAAAAALQQLNNQVIQLRSSATLLESTLKDGLKTGLSSAIQGLADGTLTLREAIGTLVQSVANAVTEMLAQIIAQKAVLSLFGNSSGGGFGGLLGFDSGGYTGPGAKYDVAGVVHAGEYVQPMEVMQQPGALQFMEAFRIHGMQALNRFSGYADGGSVGSGQLIPAPAAGAGDSPMTVQVVNTLDRDEMAQSLLSTSTASRQIKNIFKAEKSSFRAILES